MNRIKAFDTHRKLPSDLRESTTLGAASNSQLFATFELILLISLISWYRGHSRDELLVRV